MEAYAEIDQGDFGRHAWHVLRPYLLNTNFLSHIEDIIECLDRVRCIHQLGMLDLLLEAHELSLPPTGRPVEPVEVVEGMRLLDVLEKREAYLPVKNNRSFFTYGRKTEVGWNQGSKAYRRALEQLLDDPSKSRRDGDRWLQSHLLGLVASAIDHLR